MEESLAENLEEGIMAEKIHMAGTSSLTMVDKGLAGKKVMVDKSRVDKKVMVDRNRVDRSQVCLLYTSRCV